MTDREKTVRTRRERFQLFLAVPFPLILVFAVASGLPRDIPEPAWIQAWPIEGRAAGLFALALCSSIGLIILMNHWCRWVDPETSAARKQQGLRDGPLHNADMYFSLAMVVVVVAYGKQLDAAGWNWFLFVTAFFAVSFLLLCRKLWEMEIPRRLTRVWLWRLRKRARGS